MGEELPSQYDVIILGTGAPETILAAAVARIGKTVLHLDRNEYYGGIWTSFNFDNLLEWVHEHQISSQVVGDATEFNPTEEFLKEDERFITVENYVSNISNVQTDAFIEETLPQTSGLEVAEAAISEPNEPQNVQPVSHDPSMENSENKTEGCSSPDNSETEAGTSVDAPTHEAVEESINDQTVSEDTVGDHPVSKPAVIIVKNVWTIEELKAQRRKFNLDLAPKLLFSRGPLVELLISSNISRYAEFKCTTRVLTYIDGQLVQVPCSRSDVFSTKHVTVVEKRLLMKFLTFALEYQKYPEEYRGFEGRPFIEFLKSKKLTENVEHYLIHAIAMVEPNTPTLQSLKSVQTFLESLGRFGNSPFLVPLYGSAELPQCFCRLCAVFGGIYFLKRSIQALITNSEGTCTAVISDGKRLDCSWFVMESGYAPRSLIPQGTIGKISRGIFIIDGSILRAEKEQLTLLRLPPDDKLKTTVTVLELGPGACVCPNGLYVVYMSCQSSCLNAKEDLESAAETLFNCSQTGDDANKPRLLWCVYYNQNDTSTLKFSENIQSNILLTSTPDINHDYEHSVNEAKMLFERMFPEELFLPRAPDPDEIIIDGESSNPGHSKDNENPESKDGIDANDDSTLQSEEIQLSQHENVEKESTETDVALH